MIAPAALSLVTIAASCVGVRPSSASEPPVVGRPATSTVSLTRTGIPASGPPGCPAARALSAAIAAPVAVGFTARTALTPGPCWLTYLIRSRYAFTSWALVSVPAAKRRWMSAMSSRSRSSTGAISASDSGPAKPLNGPHECGSKRGPGTQRQLAGLTSDGARRCLVACS